MSIYICNNCHYIFKTDKDTECCPKCHSTSTIAYSDSGKKFNIPAIRMASTEELEKYKESENSVSKQQDFINRVKNLKNYTFNDDEYHTALMLLYYFKDTPKEFTLIKLEALLQPRNSITERKVAETAARDLYIGMQKHFTSEIGKERRETGCNDAIEVASYTQKDSAANILILFRQNFEDQIIGKSPNLTNIRKVRYDDIVKEPTNEYLRFLIEWYNSLK